MKKKKPFLTNYGHCVRSPFALDHFFPVTPCTAASSCSVSRTAAQGDPVPLTAHLLLFLHNLSEAFPPLSQRIIKYSEG